MPIDNTRLTAGLVALAGASLLLVFMMLAPPEPAASHGQEATPPEQVESNLGVFNTLDLQSKAILVFDPVAEEVLFAKNAEAQLPIASITKLMTVLVAAESVKVGTIVPFNGSRWRLGDLIDYTLVTSSNGGAEALALVSGTLSQTDFVSQMNNRAAVLGLKQTYFVNATGLDLNNHVGGSYSSATDVASLITYILRHRPELLAATGLAEVKKITLDQHLFTAPNTNELAGSLPGLVASKTGFTDLASGNLAIVFDRGLNQPVIIVALSATTEGRFTDMQKLINATLQAYAQRL